MTAQNMTYPHTNDAHRHHLLTKFTSLFFRVYIVGRLCFVYTYSCISASSNPVCPSDTQSHHGGARNASSCLQLSLAYTTGPTAAKYSLALAFIPTTSRLLYSLVSAPRSHHQSYNSASQLPHLQYAQRKIFSSQLNSPILTRTWSRPVLLLDGHYADSHALLADSLHLHLRTTGAKIYHLQYNPCSIVTICCRKHVHTH